MKRSTLWSVFLLVILTPFFLTDGRAYGKEAAPGKQQVIEMRLTHALPEADMRGRAFKFWADEVYKRTKGAVKVTVYPSESLFKTPEFFKAMVQKSVELAHLPSTFISTEVKEVAPLDVPGFIDPDKLVKVDEAIKPVMQKIFNKYDIRYIFASHEGDTTFYMRKNKIIHSPSDLKGQRIRAHGYWVGKAISAWGGTPAFIPPADVSVAFERGTVDGGYTGWPFVMAFKLFEQAPYITWVGYQNMWAFIAITGDAWRKLTPEQQRIMDEVGVEAMKLNIKLLNETRDKFKGMIKQRGGEIYNLTAKEKASFETALKPLYAELGTYSGEYGKELMGILEKIK
ncbi:MAG: TRAP transporter substrate-binding protein [Syntrophorhabdaceae bacterium]|nr:TRAP transporter substrate-binding protein [Syntrophorhabdaceae bacterium]